MTKFYRLPEGRLRSKNQQSEEEDEVGAPAVGSPLVGQPNSPDLCRTRVRLTRPETTMGPVINGSYKIPPTHPPALKQNPLRSLRKLLTATCRRSSRRAAAVLPPRLGQEGFDTMATLSGKKKSKKRSNPDPDGDLSVKKDADSEVKPGPDHEYDTNEPTMGEKLASLSLLGDVKSNEISKGEASPEMKPPSADSVYILLKQALHAEDHALLLNCLYTRDEKVITNSVSMLNPSDVLRLLDSLISMVHSRGAVLICCLPWLRSLLVHHSSSIMSQESSFSTLNSLYQLIDSRTSTFSSALQLSTCLDNIFAGIPDDEADEDSLIAPVIYEDIDSDEEAEDTMESDGENEELGAVIDSPHGSGGSDIMSDDH
ncbi:hypothetical protein Taro_054467 [Colocasia esculenta]|uniref:Small-subunit processome Utp12 domain-containing protein n=1 Tax=Colocasia esculenta TaxID=4460 RepID=A0A843XNW6_COLES|nr:hypothetical protein [Colocasia esculenta]